MSFVDKAKNAAEKAVGEVKEKVGDLTDKKDLQAEGKADQTKADAKGVGEKVKDTFS